MEMSSILKMVRKICLKHVELYSRNKSEKQYVSWFYCGDISTMHGHLNVTMHGHLNVTMHGHLNVRLSKEGQNDSHWRGHGNSWETVTF